MNEDTSKPSLKDRIIEAIIRKIEGSNDFKQKAELLVKSNPATVKTMSDLSDNQVDAIATAAWVGQQFPSMKPLTDLMNEFAAWSPSKKGKRAEQLTATMISEHTSVIPMAMQPGMQGNQKKQKKEKDQSEE